MARKNRQTDEAETAGENVSAGDPKERKSIVPAKYAGKYSKGGSDALADFINSQCSGKDGFEFTAFFTLCRKNGLPEEQVAKYEQAVADKVHGANGRARMTLRNMLGTIARKTGKLKDLKGTDQGVPLPARAPSGAAAGESGEQAAA